MSLQGTDPSAWNARRSVYEAYNINPQNQTECTDAIHKDAHTQQEAQEAQKRMREAWGSRLIWMLEAAPMTVWDKVGVRNTVETLACAHLSMKVGWMWGAEFGVEHHVEEPLGVNQQGKLSLPSRGSWRVQYFGFMSAGFRAYGKV
jgi:hypothetical protein